MEAKILKTIRLGKQRVLTIDSDYDVFIRDEVNSEKKALFTGRRFVKFMLTMEDLNRVVGKARDGKKVHVKEHLGGGWYMSLTPGVACVDVRKFFQHRDNGVVRPSKLGIALTYGEWDALVDAVTKINNEMEGFKAISTCWHATDDELEKCKECTPFDAAKEKVCVCDSDY